MKRYLLPLIFAVTSAFAAIAPTDKADLGVQRNYIANGGFERGLAGVKLYKDAAGVTPVDGTGGTTTHLTVSASSSSPLRDKRSLLISNSGSTSAQGEGVSYDFTIDAADQASVMNV